MATNTMFGSNTRLATDANGNTVLLGPDNLPKSLAPIFPKKDFFTQGQDLASPTIGWAGVTVTPGSGSVTINSSGAVTYEGESWYEVNATNAAAGNDNFEINLPVLANGQSISGDQCSIEWWSNQDSTGLVSISSYLAQGASGYGVYINASRALTALSTTNPVVNAGHNNLLITNTQWTKTPGASGLTQAADYAITHGKIRVTITTGTTIVFRLRNVSLGHGRAKGRLAIVTDDGYASFNKLALPLLQRLGFPATMAVISDVVGTGTNATTKLSLTELQNWVSQGNECVAHGPNPDGNGNLFSNGAYTFADNAARLSDINKTRDYLIANKLTSSRGARCYVFPHGQYGATAGDTALLDLMFAAGYTYARCAQTVDPAVSPETVRAMSARCHRRLTGGIVGHTYQGTAATADTDTSNVNTKITMIQRLASEGCDSALMLHKAVPRAGASGGAGTIEIEIDQLHAILSACKTLVDAGTLEVVLLSEFAQ